jgi:hypothetical protein
MSNFSGAIDTGMKVEKIIGTPSSGTHKRSYEVNEIPFSQDLRLVKRPNLLNSKDSKSSLGEKSAGSPERQVFVQDQQVHVNSLIEKPKISGKFKAKNWPDQRESTGV